MTVARTLLHHPFLEAIAVLLDMSQLLAEEAFHFLHLAIREPLQSFLEGFAICFLGLRLLFSFFPVCFPIRFTDVIDAASFLSF